MTLLEFLQSAATPALIGVIETAIERADRQGRRTYLAHLLDALLDDPTVTQQLTSADRLAARAALTQQLSDFPQATAGEQQSIAFALDALSAPAMRAAQDWGAERVAPLTLLAVCLTPGLLGDAESQRSLELVRGAGITVEKLVARRADSGVARADFTFKSLGFGTDLTAMARAGFWPGCPLIGAERELRRLVMSVSSGSDSIVVVGEPGVGKSALVHGLAYHIAQGTRPLIPAAMDSFTLVAISAVNVLAGTGGRGELEERLDAMLTFFRKNPTVVPFFDEIHTLLDTDDPTGRAIATAIKPPMVTGQFRCVGATTDKEYARFIAGDEAMSSRFTKILVPEPDEEQTVRIVEGVLPGLLGDRARALGIEVAGEALRTAVRLTSRYQRSDRQPRKTVRLIRHVVTEKTYALQSSPEGHTPTITADHVARTFSDVSGIPVDDLSEDRTDYYENLSRRLGGRVKGQDDALAGVTSWLSLHASGWIDPLRPRGRFLFLGPPGVGKTELALALAEDVMRDRGSLVIKNMAEFKGEGARTRFMGSDPGYVGFGQTATLYSQIMMRPYSVVVLDEFEKAHPSLADPLLSVFDGRAEDSQGRWVDFAQCIFVLTSNALHFGDDATEEELRQALRTLGGIWTPPLVDRIDRLVVFRPLDRATLLAILDTQIERRRSAAARALPGAIDDPAERERILDWATEGEGTASARRLERALLRWLSTQRTSPPASEEKPQ